MFDHIVVERNLLLNHRLRNLWGAWLFCLTGWACAGTVSFQNDVVPILEANCLGCHNQNLSKGDLSLATSTHLLEGGYLIPGDPDKSDLIALVVSESPGKAPSMPKEGEPLTETEVAVLRQWIAEGAAWPDGLQLRELSKGGKDWWAFQPISNPSIPAPDGIPEAWSAHPIDRFIFNKLSESGLQPSDPAEPRDMIRRLSYGLTGLPPEIREIRRFESNPSDEAYLQLLNTYLDSPRYGERWGRHWLDVVRFGESRGFERNEIINNVWPFRDYVIRAFNGDRSFDSVIREHLAGDVVAGGEPEREIGTAFLVCGPYDDVGNQDPQQAAQIRANTIDDMIRATGEAFLGLTIGCARCHDHKFDPILQEDYYRFYSIFAGVQHGSRVVARPERVKEYQSIVTPLKAERDRLKEEMERVEEGVVERAMQQRTRIESDWTRSPVDRTGTEETFEKVLASKVRLVVLGSENNPRNPGRFTLDEFEIWTHGELSKNIALAKEGSKASGTSRTAEDFSDAYDASLTIDGRFGVRWLAADSTLTIELQEPVWIDRVVFSSDRTGAAGSHGIAAFVSEYRIEVSEDGENWKTVADSFDRQPINEKHRRWRFFNSEITAEEKLELKRLRSELARVQSQIQGMDELPMVWAGTFREAKGPFHVFQGGDPARLGKEIEASGLDVLQDEVPGFEKKESLTESERRAALADWITHKDNPLTARVLVNRIWHYHFGRGLVDTPSDFGYMGSQPSHPELLDWLATQLIENEWKLKPLHRLILSSQAYRQSAAYREEAALADAESVLLWRFPPRRLSAEEIRDTFLWMGDVLDLRMGGQGFKLYRYLEDNVATYIPLDNPGPETYRRAVYHHNARAASVDLMSEFDCPDNAFPAPKRAETVSPLQALTLMNHPFSIDMAQALASRLSADVHGGSGEAKVTRLFELAFGRRPTDVELKVSMDLATASGWVALCRAVLNSNELIYLN